MVKSAFITGAADGIGAGLARQLSSLGYAVTLADINTARAHAVAQEITTTTPGAQTLAVHCDVTSDSSQKQAFNAHIQRFGSLNVVILNAGIMESGDLFDPSDAATWQRSLNVNLNGVLYGVRIAVQSMQALGTTQGGVIMPVASAGGVFPIPMGPVYSAAKAGVVMLTQSLGRNLMKKYGISIVSLCPEYVDTALVRGVREQQGDAAADALLRPVKGKLLTVEQVARVGVELVQSADQVAGKCVLVLSTGAVMVPEFPRLKKFSLDKMKSNAGSLRSSAYQGTSSSSSSSSFTNSYTIPEHARKIVVTRLSPKFRQATEIVSFPLFSINSQSLPEGCVLVKNLYCGINASDVNFTSGKYQRGGGPSEPPFDAGFEACGVVVAAGSGQKMMNIGQPVATMQYGGFSEYSIISAKQCFPIRRATPAVLALLTSGLTASISLEQTARLQHGETVLVTAAAGGTGQFFVQLAKAKGAHVIATCGSDEKGKFLKSLGADRVVNYKTENLKAVLKNEYPKGVNLVCELVGGEMFTTCLNALSPGGRLLIIGAVSQYSSGWKPSTHVGLPEKLLVKSSSLLGFFLPMYAGHFKRHLAMLADAMESGKLHVELDPSRFVGLEAVFDAVEHLQSGKSMGKVYVTLDPSVETAGGSGGIASRL
jgi:NADPH:quinone reductase-like Zn-dependent oxidoreductase/short-subunit dehydrogenase involved in D-alanine esterification of teichoic acids